MLASCSAKTLIVGGSDAVPHSQPHILSLRRSILNSHYCGGSVVSASKGVSAAHCASNRASTAVAGAHDFSSPNANEETLSYKFTCFNTYSFFDYNHKNGVGVKTENTLKIIKSKGNKLFQTIVFGLYSSTNCLIIQLRLNDTFLFARIHVFIRRKHRS